MWSRLKQAFSQRQKSHIVDDRWALSAVLVPVYYEEGEYHVLLTKRTQRVKDHKGQISFPGGAYEEADETLLDTALRECTEEIGLDAGSVELLGELDDAVTVSSRFVISPFVAAIPWPCPLKLDVIETEEIIEVPISALLERDCLRQTTLVVDGREVTTDAYNYQGHVIWGATAGILRQFLDIFARTMEDTEGQSSS